MPAEPTPRGTAPIARLAAPLAAALAALLLAAVPAGAAVPTFQGATADGEVVFFQTEESLVPGDTDTRIDVYRRSFDATVGEDGAYVTRQVSTGPTGGNDAYNALFEKVAADGARAFFSTDERLVAEDTDRRSDVYMRELATGTTTLVTAGAVACAPACGNAEIDAAFAASVGVEVFFVSDERLAAEDTDDSRDVYVRDVEAGTTTLVSAGAAACAPGCGNEEDDTFLRGVSADGSTAFFTSPEQLAQADLDTAIDVYARDLDEGTTTLVTQGDAGCAPGCGNGEAVPVFRGSSADGGRAFFTTQEPLLQADQDDATDVYARDLPGGPTILVSDGEAEALTASFNAASADGSTVLFSTTEALDGGDVNGAVDVYEWSGGEPALLTSGTCTQGSGCGANFNAATADGGAFVFTTTEQLAAADEDASADVYLQQLGGGPPELASQGDAGCAPICGNGAAAAIFSTLSADASRVLFSTAESLAAADTDANADLYRHDLDESQTELVSQPGTCPIPPKQGGCDVVFGGATPDAAHAYFLTPERLSFEDIDSEADVYERAFDAGAGAETTRLVSVGNSAELELGPATPVLEGTDPASPGGSTTPAVLGLADAETAIKLYDQAGCTGEVAATGTAEDLAGAGIEASVATGSTTSFWVTATDAHGDTSACSNSVTYVHQGGSGDAGGGGAPPGGGSGGAGPAPPALAPAQPAGPAYVVPRTRITFAPAAKTRSRRPVFRFVDATGQGGTRFRCRIDRKRWRRCGSPVRLKRKLGRGRHVFRVRAVNAAGAWERKPAKRRFKVVPR